MGLPDGQKSFKIDLTI